MILLFPPFGDVTVVFVGVLCSFPPFLCFFPPFISPGFFGGTQAHGHSALALPSPVSLQIQGLYFLRLFLQETLPKPHGRFGKLRAVRIPPKLSHSARGHCWGCSSTRLIQASHLCQLQGKMPETERFCAIFNHFSETAISVGAKTDRQTAQLRCTQEEYGLTGRNQILALF